MTKEVFWLRYQNLRNRLHSIRDQFVVAGFDADALARNLPADSYPERDLDELVRHADELAEHVREVRAAARAKHDNGIEADRNIDAMITRQRERDATIALIDEGVI